MTSFEDSRRHAIFYMRKLAELCLNTAEKMESATSEDELMKLMEQCSEEYDLAELEEAIKP